MTILDISKAIAFSKLQRIKSIIKTFTNPDTATKAHREYLAFLVNNAAEIKILNKESTPKTNFLDWTQKSLI